MKGLIEINIVRMKMVVYFQEGTKMRHKREEGSSWCDDVFRYRNSPVWLEKRMGREVLEPTCEDVDREQIIKILQCQLRELAFVF